MFSSATKISGGGYFSANGVPDTNNDDVATGDTLYVDVTAVNNAPPLGLSVVITFSGV
jgi:hypothetical protein